MGEEAARTDPLRAILWKEKRCDGLRRGVQQSE
jgi:hypothetical protein